MRRHSVGNYEGKTVETHWHIWNYTLLYLKEVGRTVISCVHTVDDMEQKVGPLMNTAYSCWFHNGLGIYRLAAHGLYSKNLVLFVFHVLYRVFKNATPSIPCFLK